MYKAHSFIISNDMIEPHIDPEVVRLQIINYNGLRVIVDKSYHAGQMCILFTEGTQIADWFLREHKLYRKNPDNPEEKWSGFFESVGVVKTIKLRGEYSRGFIYLPTDDEIRMWSLKPDSEFDTLSVNGVNKVLCTKYIREEDRRQFVNSNKQSAKKKQESNFSEYLFKHFDTPQVFEAIRNIPVNATIIATIKMHGTSGITGLLPISNIERNWRTLWRKRVKTEYRYQTQSRNVRLYSEKEDGIFTSRKQDDWYKSDFRLDIHNSIKSKLRKGETIYYEIVGYDGQKTLMPSYDNIRFTYGCNPGENAVYVYRITQLVGEDVLELSWDALVKRCHEIGLNPVLEVGRFIYSGYSKDIIKFLMECDKQYGLSDPVGLIHPCEGIVLRVEHHRMGQPSLLKHKFDEFCRLENIRLYSSKLEEPDIEQQESLSE